MRLSELADKRIINLYDGNVMGIAGDSDLLIDPITGRIVEFIIPPPRGLTAVANKRQLSIPWEAVRKIGSEVIVVDVDENGRSIDS